MGETHIKGKLKRKQLKEKVMLIENRNERERKMKKGTKQRKKMGGERDEEKDLPHQWKSITTFSPTPSAANLQLGETIRGIDMRAKKGRISSQFYVLGNKYRKVRGSHM